MTENERVNANRQPSLIWVSAILLGTAGLSGGIAGYFDSAREAGETLGSGGLAQGLGLLVGMAIMALYLSRFGAFWTNWSKRKRLYVASMILAGVMGMVFALALQMDGTADSNRSLFGSGAIDPGIAITLSAIWVGGMALSLLMYHRSVDAHEEQAYLWGGLAGFYAVVFPAPVWWLSARADLAPPVDGMILFLLALTANAIVYFWLKFR